MSVCFEWSSYIDKNMYLKSFLISLVLVLSSELCGGQILQFGACAEVQPMQYLDLERFLGEWYEIQRFPQWYERYGECAYMRLQYCERNIEIEHIYVRDAIRFILQRNSSYVPGDEAIFHVDRTNIDPVGIPLYVISTDYLNYAVLYGCKNNDILNIRYLAGWILSRNSTLSEEMLQKAQQELTSIPYANIGYLEKVEQRANLCHYRLTAVVVAENATDPFRARSFSKDDIYDLL